MRDLVNDVIYCIGVYTCILTIWAWIFGGEFKVILNNPFSKEYWRKLRRR